MARRSRIGEIAAFSGLAIGILAIAFAIFSQNSPGSLVTPPVEIGGPFALDDQNGNRVTDQSLKGKPTIVFFGFTSCPEVCPTTLAEMSVVLDMLGSDADKVNPVFVSVDPERDTQEVLRNYLTAFDSRIIGLTGSLKDVEAVAKHYRAYFKKAPLEGGDYTMDHTTIVYLMDKDGRFVAPLPLKTKPEEAAASIRKLLS